MQGARGPQTIGEGEQEEGALSFLASGADGAEPQQSVASNDRDIGAVRQVVFEVILPRPSRKHHAVPPYVKGRETRPLTSECTEKRTAVQ